MKMRNLAPLLALVMLAPAPAAQATPTVCARDYHVAPVKSPAGDYRRARVWVYGDSITVQSQLFMRRTAHMRIAVDARGGRRTDDAVAALRADLRRFRHHRPKVVVMATGSNDFYQPAAFAEQVRVVRHLLPSSVRLVWVNTYLEPFPNVARMNRTLWRAHRVHVVNWARANRRHRDGLGHSSLLRPDGVHVVERGCRARVRLILDAL